jgi:hypothetical protein
VLRRDAPVARATFGTSPIAIDPPFLIDSHYPGGRPDVGERTLNGMGSMMHHFLGPACFVCSPLILCETQLLGMLSESTLFWDA